MIPSPSPRAYVRAVIAAGLLALPVIWFVFDPAWPKVALAACVTLAVGVFVGEAFPVRLGGDLGEVAFSSTFTFALLLGWGPRPAVLVQAGACVVAALVHRVSPQRAAFNVAQYVLAVLGAATVLALLHGTPMVGAFRAIDLVEVALAAAAFFLVNTGLVTGVVALHKDLRLRDQLREELRMQTGTEGILLGMAPLALLGVQRSPLLVALLALPLLAVQRASRAALLNERLALHDRLTGLPNRALLAARAAQALARARREGGTLAVVVIDLDRFKEINDTLGHHAGDLVLTEVAARVGATLREPDTVARLGGDEFAALLPAVASAEEAVEIGWRVANAIAAPLEVSGVVLDLGASIGIACHPGHGEDVEELLQHADAAMYAAKQDQTGVGLHATGNDGQKLTQLKLAGRLSHAIASGELELLYQPQVRPTTGEMAGVEALARWRHPQFGLLAPAAFVPLAERTGHILPLTKRVLESAILQAQRWRAEGLDLTIAVNLSARSLTDPGLPDFVGALCRRCDVPPSRLVLEITEGMVLAHPTRAIPVAEALAELGAGISVDDFGIGFSSLEQLVRLPAIELKIDRSFVRSMQDDPRSSAIVRCTTELAHSLGLRVVAEGVEQPATAEAIAALGCDLAQGYLWSRPLAADAVLRFAKGAGHEGGQVIPLTAGSRARAAQEARA